MKEKRIRLGDGSKEDQFDSERYPVLVGSGE
jgi:hypothetical protein